MIVLDTSGHFAALSRRDSFHGTASALLRDEPGPRVIPAAILGELAYLIEQRLSIRVLDLLLFDIERGLFSLDLGAEDIPRVRELIRRYADLPLGLVDAAVVACTERNGGRVLTADFRHFGVVAREGTIVLALAP